VLYTGTDGRDKIPPRNDGAVRRNAAANAPIIFPAAGYKCATAGRLRSQYHCTLKPQWVHPGGTMEDRAARWQLALIAAVRPVYDGDMLPAGATHRRCTATGARNATDRL